MPQDDLTAWLRRRLTPGEYLGLELTLGAAVFVLAAWLFGSLAEDVSTGDPVTRLDEQIASWFHLHETAGLRSIMTAVSWFHTWPLALLSAVFLAYLLWRREWPWAIFGVCAVPGGMGLNTLLKLAFHRERPTLSGLSAALHTYSFPSGHALAATVVYGVVAVYAVSRFHSVWARTAILAAAALVIALVAFSRVYLGVHFLTDVIAATIEGVAWLALCFVAVQTAMARRRHRRARN